MPVLTEDLLSGAGHYIVSEANGYRSRGVGTIASGAGVLKPGSVLGKITASEKYALHDPDATNGAEIAAAVLYEGCDATSADVERTLTLRDTEVHGAELSWLAGMSAGEKTTALATLAGLGIIAR